MILSLRSVTSPRDAVRCRWVRDTRHLGWASNGRRLSGVLLDTATRFEQDGRWEIAEALYIDITERYGGTPAP